jgi:hypothetical protein
MFRSLLIYLRGFLLAPPNPRDSMGRSEMVAYEQGYDAPRKSDNPYPQGSKLHAAWNHGFQAYLADQNMML